MILPGHGGFQGKSMIWFVGFVDGFVVVYSDIFVYVFLFEKVDVDDGSFVVCCMIVVDIDGILESERY